MKYTFIVNPQAGQGAALRALTALQGLLMDASVKATVHLTERPGEATHLAREAAGKGVVVAVGGDGTVHEVVRGLAMAEAMATLGILPCGTGNDFVKMLGMPATPEAALRALLTAEARPVDYGVARWWDEGAAPDGAVSGEAAFINAVGLGFDAAVAARVAEAARRYKLLKGVPGYLLAVLHTLRGWQPLRVRGTIDAADGVAQAFDGELFLVTAGNGACSGGGFYLTPDARADDGVLDVCLVRGLTTARALRILPTALKGTHGTAPEVQMHRAVALRVETNRPVPVHADGEMLTRRARCLEVQVAAGALQVLFPRNPVWNKYMMQHPR